MTRTAANPCRFWGRDDRFDQLLREQQWVSRNRPVILPFGWPNKRLT
jgi:hypothetical protein